MFAEESEEFLQLKAIRNESFIYRNPITQNLSYTD